MKKSPFQMTSNDRQWSTGVIWIDKQVNVFD